MDIRREVSYMFAINNNKIGDKYNTNRNRNDFKERKYHPFQEASDWWVCSTKLTTENIPTLSRSLLGLKERSVV